MEPPGETVAVPLPNPLEMTSTLHHLYDTVLAERVAGRNLTGHTFGDELGARPTALVFLRHYG